MLNRGGPIEPMGIPQVNGLHPESFQALFTGDRYVCGVTTEPKIREQLDTADFGGKEDVLALLGVQG